MTKFTTMETFLVQNALELVVFVKGMGVSSEAMKKLVSDAMDHTEKFSEDKNEWIRNGAMYIEGFYAAWKRNNVKYFEYD